MHQTQRQGEHLIKGPTFLNFGRRFNKHYNHSFKFLIYMGKHFFQNLKHFSICPHWLRPMDNETIFVHVAGFMKIITMHLVLFLQLIYKGIQEKIVYELIHHCTHF